jgi:hypothetical protein
MDHSVAEVTEIKKPLLGLLPQHLEDLRRSGLSEETIARCGCYSIVERSEIRSLGFGHVEPPAMALPILPPDRTEPDVSDVMLKPDVPRTDKRGHAAKYEARPNSRNRIHAPLAIRDKLSDASQPLVIAEGQKKSEKGAQERICVIALAGVWNWRDRIGDSSFPISDFELFPLEARRVLLCFDSDAISNNHVRQAERDLAGFLRKRFGARVAVKRLPPGVDGGKVGLDDFLLTHTAEEFWALPEYEPAFDGHATASSAKDWPEPAPLGDELPSVQSFDLELLPTSFRPLVQDVSDRMQAPPDFAAGAAIVTLAGCVNRRAAIHPKAADNSWRVVPNLWGAIVGHPGFMKSPILRAITQPLAQIEEFWRAEYAEESGVYQLAKEQAELRWQAWREDYKQAIKKGTPAPVQPDNSLRPPALRRISFTNSTFEKLHEILSENPAGGLVVRDELTGWLAELDKQGREGERGFYLQAWNGDAAYTVDRIGRGSIYVPAVCISLLGNIQPARLRWFLSQAFNGGRGDDGLFQRFQILVWPDPPSNWRLIDRPPNGAALGAVEKIFSDLANLSADDPVRMRFDPEAQLLFYKWLSELENKIRSDLPAPFVAHLAKYRSLMPSLAGLFELADLANEGGVNSEALISLGHAQQAAALCDYLESHARRVYACVISPECKAARELARHIQNGDLAEAFATRSVYLKGWAGLDTPERVRGALYLLEDAGWLRRAESPSLPAGGRPSEVWEINPRLVRHEK